MWDKIKKLAADAQAKAGELAVKGLAATPDLMKKAAVGLQGADQFEDAKKKNKRFVVVFGSRTDLGFQKLLALMPVHMTKAWITNTALKTMELDDYTDLARALGVATSPTALYFLSGELKERHEGVDAVNGLLGRLNTL